MCFFFLYIRDQVTFLLQFVRNSAKMKLRTKYFLLPSPFFRKNYQERRYNAALTSNYLHRRGLKSCVETHDNIEELVEKFSRLKIVEIYTVLKTSGPEPMLIDDQSLTAPEPMVIDEFPMPGEVLCLSPNPAWTRRKLLKLKHPRIRHRMERKVRITAVRRMH